MMNVKALLERGLWPFTPDPLAPGLYTLGSPAGTTPLLITGNSRHTHNFLKRFLAPLGVRVLAVDTGGVDVYSALAAGGWSLDRIGQGLEKLESEMVEPQALLPYPVWEVLGDGEIEGLAGWRIRPGPADARHLPAFLARGRELTDDLKTMRFPWEDRLRLALAHAGLFALIAAVPLLLFGLKVLAAGLGMAILSAGLLALTWPWLPGKRGWLKGACLGAVMAALTYGVSLAFQAEAAQRLVWAFAGVLVIQWLAIANRWEPGVEAT